MRTLPFQAIATSRGFISAAAAVVGLASTAIAFAAVLPVGSGSLSNDAPLARPDFDLVFASLNAGSPARNLPAIATIDFDQAFASIATPYRDNTPSNREKLRNA